MKNLHPVRNRLPMGLRKPHRQAKIAARMQVFIYLCMLMRRKIWKKREEKQSFIGIKDTI